jgi:hypothetical protein
MVGAELVGSYALRRSVQDRRAHLAGTVTGSMNVVVEVDRLAWRECGELSWNGRTVPVSRTSFLVDLDGQPWMTFADGRPFHPWRPGEDVSHPCGADLYVGRIEVSPAGIRTVWRVTGPAKEQRLTTDLTPMRDLRH